MNKYLIYSFLLVVILIVGCGAKKDNDLREIGGKVLNNQEVLIKDLDSLKLVYSQKQDSGSLAVLNYFYAKFYQPIERDSALEYRKRSMDLAKKVKNDSLLIDLFLLNSELATNNVDVYLTSLLKADTLANKTNDVRRKSIVQLRFGSFFYDRDQVKCAQYLDSALAGFRKLKDNKNIALSLQNKASLVNEKEDNAKEALELATEAKKYWALNKDSLNEAYMIQYMGILEGKLDNLGKGKTLLLEAAGVFKTLNAQQEGAVCYFDLANICEKQNQIDSSLVYLDKAKTIWELNRQPQSLFSVQNYMLKLFLQKGNSSEAFDYYSRNLLLEKGAPIHWKDRINYYQLSQLMFEQKKDKDMANLYAEEITELKASLTENGITFN